MQNITYAQMRETLQRLFLKYGLPRDRTEICSEIITESTFDGIFSHGINMVPGFMDRIQRGLIAVEAEPNRTARSGVIEQWDGKCGIGIYNARAATLRAMEIAENQGIGCVALRNTNHWFRAGSYGWQATPGDATSGGPTC